MFRRPLEREGRLVDAMPPPVRTQGLSMWRRAAFCFCQTANTMLKYTPVMGAITAALFSALPAHATTSEAELQQLRSQLQELPDL